MSGAKTRLSSARSLLNRAAAHLRQLALGADGELDVSLKLWPGAPKTRAMRPFTTTFSEDPPIPSILLGETQEEIEQTLRDIAAATPGGVFLNVGTGTIDLESVYNDLIRPAAQAQFDTTDQVRRFCERLMQFRRREIARSAEC